MTILAPKEYYESLAKKPMGSGALFFNEQQELLIVKPNYKDWWLIPGGTVEVDESPRECARREVKEEIGLDVEIGKLLCVDYGVTPQGDNLKFIFAGGTLTAEQIAQIRLQESELVEYKFVPMETALQLLGVKKIKRIPHCLEALKSGKAVYLEEGELR